MLQTGKSPDSYRDWSLCRFKHLKVSVLWAFRFNPGQGWSALKENLSSSIKKGKSNFTL